MAISWLNDDAEAFPPLACALREPDGLIAAGGDLRPERLLAAYRRGIFPWYEEPQPILWWSPDPRAVLFPDELHVSTRLRRTLRRGSFRVSADSCFDEVIHACAAPRRQGSGTWIGSAMQRAYSELHRLGHAHSIETWQEDQLVGGLYGIAIGRIFFGESMFARVDDASRVALVHLVGQLRAWGFALVDCQQDTGHMRSMGARTITRAQFRAIVDANVNLPGQSSPWHLEWSFGDAAWATR
jgi:leucyl/phenylalanyl-tRNA---protein transferase